MKISKKIAIAVTVIMLTILLQTTKVQANYQSMPTAPSNYWTPAKEIVTTMAIGVRQMESAGQGMGLTETIDTTTALATSESNNIDVHLQKNTEYGAIVLLGASNYGKQGNSITARRMNAGAATTSGTDVKATTTGNVTGIYEMGYSCMRVDNYQGEHTTGGGTAFLSNIASRYRNIYTTDTDSAKVGDATTETDGWHESNSSSWLTGNDKFFCRGVSDGPFKYNGWTGNSSRYFGRAIVVCRNWTIICICPLTY